EELRIDLVLDDLLVIVVAEVDFRGDVVDEADVVQSERAAIVVTAHLQLRDLRIAQAGIVRYPIARVREAVIKVRERLLAVVAEPALRLLHARLRVLDLADRRVVIAGSLAPARRPELPVPPAEFEARAASAEAVVRATGAGDEAANTGARMLVN